MSFVRWFLQRITGLLLVACLATHTIIMHFTGHSPIDANAVHERLKDAFWLVFYIVFLSSTLLHGLNGIYEIIDDYKPSPKLQLLLGIILWGAGLAAILWGVYVLIQWRNVAL